jgi:bifunctional oligoribonuclease and PAP phosphatase NrnA
MMIPEELQEIIRKKENFVIVTHVHPDGDALGSLLGLTDILEGLGKRVLFYLEEPVSYLYEFLPGCTRACYEYEEVQQFIDECDGELACVALDCGDADRMGERKNLLLKNHPFLVVDHHHSHKPFGDYRWVEPGMSSTGEMVYELGLALDSSISYQAAFNLFVAISTDTGSFRYDATTPRTLRIAANLVEIGVQPHEIANRLYENSTLERLRLMELVLGTLEMHVRNQVAVIHVTKDMFEKSGAIIDDVEGFIDHPRTLRSVKVAVFLKETERGVISVSLRAKGECDVSRVAKSLGGGGHRNASGFRFSDLSLELAKDKIVTVLERALLGEPGLDNGHLGKVG